MSSSPEAVEAESLSTKTFVESRLEMFRQCPALVPIEAEEWKKAELIPIRPLFSIRPFLAAKAEMLYG